VSRSMHAEQGESLPYSAVFGLFFTGAAAGQNKPGRGERERTEPGGRGQGVSESAVCGKRGWLWFGAQPAHSETPARAAAERSPRGRGRSGAGYGKTNKMWMLLMLGMM
jgi:hypothetical protein